MKRQNGGYLIIDLSSATLVGDLAKAYANGKPVLVYENDKATWCVIKENEGAYTLINSDTTYSISSEGVVTTESSKLYIHRITIDGSFEVQNVSYDLLLEAVIYSSKIDKYKASDIVEVGQYINNINIGVVVNGDTNKYYNATLQIGSSGTTRVSYIDESNNLVNLDTNTTNFDLSDILI